MNGRISWVLSGTRHRFSLTVIRHAVWTYDRFTTSLRDDVDRFAERGIGVSCETGCCWASKLGPTIACSIR